jgi:diacylglycerol kinase
MINPYKFRSSLSHAFSGIKYLYLTQNNVRIHALATISVIILGFWFRLSPIEWVIISIVIGIVWIIEAINTVFERLFDLLDESYNPLIKIGKDVSAASVLISASISALVGILIFFPHLAEFIKSLGK